MALQSFQLDPSSGGVSQGAFDNHTHGYRKITQIGVSRDHLYEPVLRYDIIDDSEVVSLVGSNQDLEAVGITVATDQTEVPT